MGSTGVLEGAAVLSPIVGGFGPSAARLTRSDAEVLYTIAVTPGWRLDAIGIECTDNAIAGTLVIASLVSIAGAELLELKSDGSGRRQLLKRAGIAAGPGTYYLGCTTSPSNDCDIHRWMHRLVPA